MGVSISLVAPLFVNLSNFSFPMIPVCVLTLCIIIFVWSSTLMDYSSYE